VAYRSDRRGVLIVLLAVMALAVGVFIGFLLDKDGTNNTTVPAPTTSEAAGPGPTAELNGVPVGYSRTEDGAVAAATNFQLLSAKDSLLDREALVTAMQTLAAPGWTEEAARQARNGYDYIVDTYGNDADVTAAVLRYEVTSFDSDRATVRLWVVTTISGSKRPNVEATWGVVTIDLEWAEDDWRATGIESSPGPAPVELPSGQPGQSAFDVMEEFDEFGGAPRP